MNAAEDGDDSSGPTIQNGYFIIEKWKYLVVNNRLDKIEQGKTEDYNFQYNGNGAVRN